MNRLIRSFILLAGLLTAARADDALSLWPKGAPGSQNAPKQEIVVTNGNGDRTISGIGVPTITAVRADRPNGTAMVVVPGGAYLREEIDKEGFDVARWLASQGINAYVLKYRLPNEGHAHGRNVPLQDIQRAVRLIRAGETGSAPPKFVGVMGFSAGGHLVATLAAYADAPVQTPQDGTDLLPARPDFWVALYPYIPRRAELPAPSDERMALFTTFPFEEAVNAHTPPAFIAVGSADTRVPTEHSRRINDALAKAGVPAELHVFAEAPHGFALRGKGPEKNWPDLCLNWMRRTGFLPTGK